LIDPKVRDYVRRVVQRSVTICGAHLRSVVLFGSAARGQFSKDISDIDVILVVSDDTPNQVVRKLDTELERFEENQGPMKHRSHFLKLFSYKTALFRSHFVVREGPLRSLNTHRLCYPGQEFRPTSRPTPILPGPRRPSLAECFERCSCRPRRKRDQLSSLTRPNLLQYRP